MIEAEHISHEFFRLTLVQAKALVCDGILPGPGKEKQAKPAAELNKLLRRKYWNRMSGNYDREPEPLLGNSTNWITRTRANGVEVWAIHCYLKL